MLNLEDVKEIASQQSKSYQNRKLLLDKIRKNLMTLMCQTDVVEITGNVEAFGGDKDVSANLGKAVFGLFCLGATLNVDVTASLEKLITDINAKQKKDRADGTQEKTGAAHDKPEGAETGEKGKNQPGPDTAKPGDSKDTASPGSDAKAKNIERYKKSFQEAKSLDEVKKIANEIRDDTSLDGKEKYSLEPVKKEAVKRLSASH